jgi:hypothetical protein
MNVVPLHGTFAMNVVLLHGTFAMNAVLLKKVSMLVNVMCLHIVHVVHIKTNFKIAMTSQGTYKITNKALQLNHMPLIICTQTPLTFA